MGGRTGQERSIQTNVHRQNEKLSWWNIHCWEQNAKSDVASKKKKDFYEFESDEEESSIDSLEVQAAEYFSMAREMSCLHKFPTIKRILQYNITIPSSAPVKRLFSHINLVLTPRQKRLNASQFEKLLLFYYYNCRPHMYDYNEM